MSLKLVRQKQSEILRGRLPESTMPCRNRYLTLLVGSLLAFLTAAPALGQDGPNLGRSGTKQSMPPSWETSEVQSTPRSACYDSPKQNLVRTVLKPQTRSVFSGFCTNTRPL